MSLEFSPARATYAGRTNKIARVLISDVEAAEILGCSRSTIWRRVADDTLPRPIRLGGLSRFVLSEINARVEAAMTARDGKAAVTGPENQKDSDVQVDIRGDVAKREEGGQA
jgi:predicted DNA-binding transcriptional regulator AlpA